MSPGWRTDRSADDLDCWFSTGGASARRSSKGERANGHSFQDIPHRPSTQMAFATLVVGHYPRRRTILGRARTPPAAINRHSA
jgi:hypothetical protein